MRPLQRPIGVAVEQGVDGLDGLGRKALDAGGALGQETAIDRDARRSAGRCGGAACRVACASACDCLK